MSSHWIHGTGIEATLKHCFHSPVEHQLRTSGSHVMLLRTAGLLETEVRVPAQRNQVLQASALEPIRETCVVGTGQLIATRGSFSGLSPRSIKNLSSSASTARNLRPAFSPGRKVHQSECRKFPTIKVYMFGSERDRRECIRTRSGDSRPPVPCRICNFDSPIKLRGGPTAADVVDPRLR